MRRNDALLAGVNLAVAAFLAVAGPSMAIAAASPGGSHGNGGNSSSGNTGSNQGSASRGSSGGGNSGNGGAAARSNSGGNSSVSAQTNTGSSSNGKGNGNSSRNNFAPGAQSNSGSDGPEAPSLTPPSPPVPVVVADQHVGTAPAGRPWSSVTDAAPPIIELRAPTAPSEEGTTDLLSIEHAGIPVWVAAEPVGLRGDLFGLAGLVLMPLIGLAVGYRQAKAARDVGSVPNP